MSYVAIPDGRIYFCNGQVHGYIKDNVVHPIPAVSLDVKLKIPLPMGTHVEFYRSRLYVGSGKTMFVSDAAALDRVSMDSPANGFRQFDSDITMIRAVDDGLFVSTGKGTYSIGGDVFETATMVKVSDSSAIPFTDGIVKYNYTVEGIFKYNYTEGGQSKTIGKAAMWLSTTGICRGLNGGRFENLTNTKMNLSPLQNGTGCHIVGGGMNHYVVINYD
jgi:hypothetical protein